MKETLKNIFVANTERDLSAGLIPRITGISLQLNKIQAIIGPRRVGKTSAILLAMDELKKNRKVPESLILYFNFEDERVQFDQTKLDILLQAWQELYPDVDLKKIWFFFDEVQSAPGWERFLNRINETYSKHIVFTGSNSAVLHTEIKSVMRGRSIAIEMLPLSFKEFCFFKGFSPVAYGKGKNKTLATFNEYLQKGGYPEIVNIEQSVICTAYLQEYFNTMLLRDIVDYNNLSNYGYLRSLYRHAATSIGKTISIRRLHNQLKSQGYSVALNSIYEVMDMAENAYLFKRISRFDYSEMKRNKSDKKIYWIDNGLLNSNTMKYSGNKGMLLENCLFWELYRRYGNIYNTNIYYYTEVSSECDFIVYPEGGQAIPVQICWSLENPETKQREIKGLLKACAYCKVDNGWIITAEEDDELALEGVNISVKAAWKWMIE